MAGESEPRPGAVPFGEAIDHFAAKVKLPTRHWTDLWEGMHARAFVVAGAMDEALLSDFREAILAALEEGRTLADFRKDFDRIVQKHGWSHTGGPAWRARVIFDTNVRMAHAAGRWKPIDRLKARRPWLVYGAVDDTRTRPRHKAWDNTVLPVDHPWWDSHYPPNDWFCRCTVRQLNDRDLKRYGLAPSEEAPDSHIVTHHVNTPAGPAVVRAPVGVGPGFNYHPGKAAWGTTLTEQAMEAWRQQGAKAWRRLTPGDWRSAGRPERLPVDAPTARPGPPAGDANEVVAAVRQALGADERIFELPDGTHVVVNAEPFGRHVDPVRAAYAPLIPELLTDPAEVWLAFERHRETGRVVLRKRLVKAVRLGKNRFLLMVAQAAQGRFEAWTFLETNRPGYIQDQRVGRLLWGRSVSGET